MGDQLPYTPVGEIADVVEELRSSFAGGRTTAIDFRIHQLQQLAYLLSDHQEDFVEAFKLDLGRSRGQVLMLEIAPCLKEIIYLVKNVRKWSRPQAVSAEFPLNFARPNVLKSPRGLCLVIAPWNYPLNLMLKPVAGAIAAGNTVVLKPSETAANVNALLTRLLPEYLDSACYRVINGAIDQSKELLRHKWDYIFYTGGGAVGKIVARAAADHLTPYTLELGGQCPVIIDSSCSSIDIAAKRVIWGRNLNAGQTCVACNHVFVAKSVHAAFVQAATKWIKALYVEHGKEEHGKIIAPAHEKRLSKILAESKGEILVGGKSQENGHFAATLVDNVQLSDSLMSEEIFGPILPVIEIDDIDQAIQAINNGGCPLAIYLFTSSSTIVQKVTDRTRSGALVINDCVTQQAIPSLPFGGVGDSGSGNYNGKRTFDTFSYERACMNVPNYIESLLDVRYPPSTPLKQRLYDFLLAAKIPFARPKARASSVSSSAWIRRVLFVSGLIAAIAYFRMK